MNVVESSRPLKMCSQRTPPARPKTALPTDPACPVERNTFASWVPQKEIDCLVAENGRPAGETFNLQSLANCAVAAVVAAVAAAVGFVVQNPTFGGQ